MSQTVIKIQGMSCGHCVASVTSALKAVAGVSEVAVDLGKKEATVNHQGASVSAMQEAVENAGYDVEGVA